jgi:hypothetical protein
MPKIISHPFPLTSQARRQHPRRQTQFSAFKHYWQELTYYIRAQKYGVQGTSILQAPAPLAVYPTLQRLQLDSNARRTWLIRSSGKLLLTATVSGFRPSQACLLQTRLEL